MTPEQLQLLTEVNNKLNIFLDVYYRENFNDKFSTRRKVEALNELTTGKNSKIGFFGVTSVVQSSAITVPAGGGSSATDAIDISGRSATNAIITALKNIGVTL